MTAAAGLLDVIEGLKQQADGLQAELREAGQAAEVAARRSRRLAERSRQLQVTPHLLLNCCRVGFRFYAEVAACCSRRLAARSRQLQVCNT